MFRKKHQLGSVTLVVTLALLLSISLIVLFTARSGALSLKVASNDYRAKLAFSAADAGIDYGITYLQNNSATIVVDANNDSLIDSYTTLSNYSLSNGTKFSVQYSNPVAGDFRLIQVQSTGVSDDSTATRVVKQLVEMSSALTNNPSTPLTVKGNVSLSGDVNVKNTVNNVTIWSGGTTSLSGSASTTTNSGGSSSGNIKTDIVQNDPALANVTNDAFFKNFFGSTKSEAQASANTVYNNSSDTNYSSLLNGVTNKFVWINQTGGSAQINANTTMGSSSAPVILVVNGDFKINGTLTVYGVVYVIGNWNNSGGGTATIYGSTIVEGNMTSEGTPNIIYSPTILTTVRNTVGKYVKVPGSWIDL